MQIPILIEPVAGNGYRASGCEPFAFSVEGATREEALGKLRDLIQRRLSAGAELVQLELQAPHNSWISMAGMFDPNDPLVQEWEEIMKENRQKADAEPDLP